MIQNKLKATIAGASGFVGLNLSKKISNLYQIRGLSRKQRDKGIDENISWSRADLFSFQSTNDALKDTDIAIYLVHSMLPSSRLFQGSFQDTDLFIAHNFASACVQNNVKQIIYVGGLVPEVDSSPHLESRKEVEELLKNCGIPTTILRAGMVVGDGGSSFEILKNLVINLPLMVLPKWTRSTTQAIYIDDLVHVISTSINDNKFFDRTINVVNGESLTYRKLIEDASKYFSTKKILLPIPINYTSFSKLWVKIFGQADYELVSPLIDSLKCNLPDDKSSLEVDRLVKYKTFEQMLQQVSKEKTKKYKQRKNKVYLKENTVRSIQRLSNPNHLSPLRICDLYMEWLPLYLKKIVRVNSEDDKLIFKFLWFRKPLLILQRINTINEIDRIKLHIVGGLLTKTKDTGWLEFRQVSGGKYTLASINEFIPSLPWYIYCYTQAVIHLIVMKRFNSFLKNLKQ